MVALAEDVDANAMNMTIVQHQAVYRKKVELARRFMHGVMNFRDNDLTLAPRHPRPLAALPPL
jgi:hypothetical protein